MTEVVTKLLFQAISKRQDFENIMLLNVSENRRNSRKKNQIKDKETRGRNCISLLRVVLKYGLLLETELCPN